MQEENPEFDETIDAPGSGAVDGMVELPLEEQL